MPATDRIAFVSSGTPEADSATESLRTRYGHVEPEQASVVVALGGDGLMLQTLHQVMDLGIPVYGMNFGSVGFLMNPFSADGLVERLAAANATDIYPLSMVVRDAAGASAEVASRGSCPARTLVASATSSTHAAIGPI